MLFKIVVLAILLLIVYFIFFKKRGVSKEEQKRLESTMVECDACSVFVSTDEALIKDGKFYCSKECLANDNHRA